MKYIDIINYGNKKLEQNKLEKNVSFKLLFFIDKNINNISEFVENKNKKIIWYKSLIFKYYLFQYIHLNKPLQYITKESYFFDNDFILYKDVHSPKIESEILVKKALDLIKINKYKKVLDLCCGTGVLGISVLLNSNAFLTFTDISNKAIKNTNLNLQKYKLKANVIKSNLFKKIKDKYDLIICNPPYISFGEKRIDKSVKKYESKKALFAKDNGLYFYKEIMKNVDNFISPNGSLILEIGYNQIEDVLKIIRTNNNVKKIEKIKDDLNYYRVVVVYF